MQQLVPAVQIYYSPAAYAVQGNTVSFKITITRFCKQQGVARLQHTRASVSPALGARSHTKILQSELAAGVMLQFQHVLKVGCCKEEQLMM